MNIKYRTNFSGYISLHRSIQLMLQGKLDFTELGIYICFIMQADFDRRHKLYGCIIRDDEELAKSWNCSYDTVHRYKRKFVAKGLFLEKDGVVMVPMYLFELDMVKSFARLPLERLRDLFVKPQFNFDPFQRELARLRDNQARNAAQSSTFSSKGDLSLSDKDLDEIARHIDSNDQKVM